MSTSYMEMLSPALDLEFQAIIQPLFDSPSPPFFDLPSPPSSSEIAAAMESSPSTSTLNVTTPDPVHPNVTSSPDHACAFYSPEEIAAIAAAASAAAAMSTPSTSDDHHHHRTLMDAGFDQPSADMVMAIYNDPTHEHHATVTEMIYILENPNTPIPAEDANNKKDTSLEGVTREGQPCTPLHVVQHVLDNMHLYTEDEIANLRNGMYNEQLTSHFYSRIALLIQKTLFMAHYCTGAPLSTLTFYSASLEMYKCQACIKDPKSGAVRRCNSPATAGYFFCGKHRHDYSHKEGAELMKKRRLGEQPEDDDEDAWISSPGKRRCHLF